MSETKFSDPSFNDQIDSLRATHEAELLNEQAARNESHLQNEQKQEQLNRLSQVSFEVAQAAAENPDTYQKQIQFFTHEEKSPFGKFMDNRGKLEHVPAVKGWIIVPSTSDKLTSLKPNLANKSGLGLMLAEDGKLYGYFNQKGPNLRRDSRDSIQRRTMIPIDKLPEKTFLPRSRGVDRPTLLLAMADPANQLATPQVIDQCFNALAKFVQSENLDAEPEPELGALIQLHPPIQEEPTAVNETTGTTEPDDLWEGWGDAKLPPLDIVPQKLEVEEIEAFENEVEGSEVIEALARGFTRSVIAYAGLARYIAAKRQERAGTRLERREHKAALHDDLSRLSLTGIRGLTPVPNGDAISPFTMVAVPRTAAERLVERVHRKQATRNKGQVDALIAMAVADKAELGEITPSTTKNILENQQKTVGTIQSSHYRQQELSKELRKEKKTLKDQVVLGNMLRAQRKAKHGIVRRALKKELIQTLRS